MGNYGELGKLFCSSAIFDIILFCGKMLPVSSSMGIPHAGHCTETCLGCHSTGFRKTFG